MSWYDWRPYVPVGVRRARAVKKLEKLRKKGIDITPVAIAGRKIAKTFWGKAWCDHLESFSDYANRLPRGRTYVRNGMVCHLAIGKGAIDAMVSGSRALYGQDHHPYPSPGKMDGGKNPVRRANRFASGAARGPAIKERDVRCDRPHHGLFPLPKEIRLECSCPDWAVMCKHVAAVLYGVGARLDEYPELLFLLRGVDHDELIDAEIGVTAASGKTKCGRRRISEDALADVFGIEISDAEVPVGTKVARRRKKPAPKAKKTSAASTEMKMTSRSESAPVKGRAKKKPKKRGR